MANEAYLNNATRIYFSGASGADIAFSVEGLANAAGWVSAQKDLGVAPRPYRFKWSCEVQWQATPNQGGVLELYVASAPDHDASQISGDCGTSDAALGDIDMRRNMKFIGAVVSENAAANEVCVSNGVFEHYERYISLVAYNSGGSAVNATDTNFRLDLVPFYDQGQ